MKAKKKPIDTRELSLGDGGSENGVTIMAMRFPDQRKGGRIIEGDTPADLAAKLVKALREEAKVL